MTEKNDGLASEIATGDCLTLVELARLHKSSPSTVFRWKAKGLPDGRGGRIYLVCVRRGKKWLTSSAAVARFFSSLPRSDADHPTASSRVRSPTKRERDSDRAQAILKEKYGI